MSATKNVWLAGASALVILATPAFAQNANVTVVSPDGPAEQAGEAVDNAAAATAEAAGDAADATASTVENAADATSEAAAEMTDGDVVVVETDEEMEEAEVPEGTPLEGQIFEQSADTFLASVMMDSVVRNAAGEEIGDVNDLVLSGDGQVSGVVIGVGGFLGIGEKDVAIESSRIEITETEDGELQLVLDVTEEELDAAPEFLTAEEAAAARGSMDASDAGMSTTDGGSTAPMPATSN